MSCKRLLPACMYEASGAMVCGRDTQHDGMLDILSGGGGRALPRGVSSSLPPATCYSSDMADVVNGRGNVMQLNRRPPSVVDTFISGAPVTADYTLGVTPRWHVQPPP